MNLDPIYWLLKRFVLNGFFHADLTKEEHRFLLDNLSKHRKVLWLNVIAAIVVYFALGKTPENDIATVIFALLAPVAVMGTAWFTVSFGGIPAKLIQVAMIITFWMFSAFTVSFTALIVAIIYVTPPISYIVWLFIYLAAIIACVQYDTTDGLKAGLDEAVFKHSRAALVYYQKKGIKPEDLSANQQNQSDN
ncbi:MAG: hypothetical protein WC805_02060 [Patescibacteria group bacterium]|jgi:apolipoprotein N-acyltransferase